MALNSGDRLGPYEIVAPVGAGGMGEVYRARDTRLDRTVAVKVLPEHTADRPEVRQRFEREARAVSALNHPNICTLYDIGQHEGIDYLVMEYLEGETLADRLKKGAMPLDQSLRIATQVADALDRAHRTGITHRDLKPGNIMLTKDGTKVLDFGLAKMRDRAAGTLASGGTVVETLTSPLTGQGAIVGTLQYMAPEQLEGQEADARSDIFAFGAIVYEMVSGRRPFDGKTQATLIAKILEHEPAPVSTVMPAAPPALEQLLRSCLAKDPAERRQTMHDVLLDLRWITEGGSRSGIAPAPPIAVKSKRPWGWMAAAGVLALAALALGGLYFLQPRPDVSVMRFAIPPPEKNGYGDGLAISPDGKRLVFSAVNATGQSQLWLQALDSLTAQPIPGTTDGRFPFWSPDSKFIGFFDTQKLKKVDIVGGPVQELADAPDGRGGTWNRDGVILFAPTTNVPLQRISSAGGIPVAVTKRSESRKEVGHRWPYFLPDGKHYLCFTYCGGPGNAIAAGSLDSMDLTILAPADSRPAYSPPGYVLFVKGNILLAQAFDAGKMRLSGDPMPLAQHVAAEGESGPTAWARFSASPTGILTYVTGNPSMTMLTWFDRTGKSLGQVGDAANYGEPSMSPDAKKVIFDWTDSPSGNNLWSIDLTRNVKSRFSNGTVQEAAPVFSRDGKMVVFASLRKAKWDLYVRPADGGPETLLLGNDENNYPDDWAPDNKTIVFEVVNRTSRKGELWNLSVDSRKVTPFLQAQWNAVHAAISPDGHWIAYTSDETGRSEVYVQSYPDPSGAKHLISTGGGDGAAWRNDGKELFYVTADQKLMAVTVAAGAKFQVDNPHVLFQTNINQNFGVNGTLRSYAPSADGQKFLICTASETVSSAPLTAVLNWSAGLAK